MKKSYLRFSELKKQPMVSSLATALDQPISGPPSHALSRTQDWYEEDQTTNLSGNIGRPASMEGYSYEQLRPNRSFPQQKQYLQQHYTILGNDGLLNELLEGDPGLYSLLMDALDPIHRAFGVGRIIHLRVLSSDDDRVLKAAVQLPAGFVGDPENVLRSFDAHWWLDNCHRSRSLLVFDYEIQDAV